VALACRALIDHVARADAALSNGDGGKQMLGSQRSARVIVPVRQACDQAARAQFRVRWNQRDRRRSGRSEWRSPDLDQPALMLPPIWMTRHPRASAGAACIAAAGIQRETPPKATKSFFFSVLILKVYGRLRRSLTLDLRRRGAPRGAHESKMTSHPQSGWVFYQSSKRITRHPRASAGAACIAAAGIQRETPPKATKSFVLSVLILRVYGRLRRSLTLDLRRRDAPRSAHESKMTSHPQCGWVFYQSSKRMTRFPVLVQHQRATISARAAAPLRWAYSAFDPSKHIPLVRFDQR
jgi:hypothetical protein